MKKTIILVTIVILILLGLLLWKSGQEEQDDNRQYERMEKELIPLKVEKRKLEQKLVDLQLAHEVENAEKGTATMLFTELPELLYTTIFPKVQEKNFIGTMVLSRSQLPGTKECITMEQFQTLVTAGWSYCVAWEDNAIVKGWLQSKGMALSQAVYFRDNTYDETYDVQILNEGYHTIIRYSDGELTLTPPSKNSQIWRTDVLGLQESGSRKQLENTINQKGHIVYLIGFKKLKELYEETKFLSMLNWFQRYEEEERLLITDFAGARVFHEEMEVKQSLPEETRAEQIELEEQIANIEKQIHEVYRKYE